jgi:hypothetical protein
MTIAEQRAKKNDILKKKVMKLTNPFSSNPTES